MTDPHAIAAKLTKAQREALLLFDADDMLRAENDEEVILVREMMNIGLVGELWANGLVFMTIQPFGREVRAAIKEQDDAE